MSAPIIIPNTNQNLRVLWFGDGENDGRALLDKHRTRAIVAWWLDYDEKEGDALTGVLRPLVPGNAGEGWEYFIDTTTGEVFEVGSDESWASLAVLLRVES